MSVGGVLFDILVVLVAAKLAAEVSERLGIPAVVGEIVAGIIIGGSFLGLVGDDEVLRTLAEIGVILLLVEVGMEMDPGDLARVGRPALLVATAGVALPFVGGYFVARALGIDGEAALFLGASLTATSVGITARVFGDLKALNLVEARTVLGAAVADDVIGLVILTVVAGIATGAAVSAFEIAGIAGLAVAVLVGSALVGGRVAPLLFELVQRRSRSTGTLVALALAFVLVFALIAEAAGLAPIIGAFVAGIAMARSTEADRIRRELAPVGHLFIPVFFLQVGMDARVQQFIDRDTLILAGFILAVAVLGKLASGFAAIGLKADKGLIGLGMLPRGEVGLIFAGLGLREGVLQQDVYGALLFVVFATTLVAPPLLRARLKRRAVTQQSAVQRGSVAVDAPVVDGGRVELSGPIQPGRALQVALDSALIVADGARPGAYLLEELGSLTASSLRWDKGSKARFFDVLAEGNARSWRFLEASGVLDRVLPELSEVLRLRRTDPFELDPAMALRWEILEDLHDIARNDDVARAQLRALPQRESLYLSALALDATVNEREAVKLGRRLAGRLSLGARIEQTVATVCGDAQLLRSALGRRASLEEVSVLQIAGHLRRPEAARALYLISLAQGELDIWRREELDRLHGLIQAVLARNDVSDASVGLVERRRSEAMALLGSGSVATGWMGEAPPAHVVAVTPTDFVRQVHLLQASLSQRTTRVEVAAGAEGEWLVEVASPDRRGLLAYTTGVLALAGLDVLEAVATTWPNGTALQSFTVTGPAAPPAPEDLKDAIERAMEKPLRSSPIPDASVSFDDTASPWATRCEITTADRRGLLHSLAVAMAASDVDIRSAKAGKEEDRVLDRFELVVRGAGKVPDATKAAIEARIRSGVETTPSFLIRIRAHFARFLHPKRGGERPAARAEPPG